MPSHGQRGTGSRGFDLIGGQAAVRHEPAYGGDDHNSDNYTGDGTTGEVVTCG